MSKIYKYQSDIRGNYNPLIPVRLKYLKTQNNYLALIDSGASVSIFKTDVAEYLGIDIEKGSEIELRGAGGWLKGYIHNLSAEVAGKKFKCQVVFSRDYLVPLNIIGRRNFFENFRITFDEAKKSVILE
jgi:hypothetical protein